jgi:hypothetical protein
MFELDRGHRMKTAYIIIAIVVVASVFLKLYTHEPTGEVIVREPAVAGTFYTSDPSTLSQQITYFLENAEESGVEDIQALIVPHAGYIYSGHVAAFAYKQLEGKHFDTVVIIGPSHHVYFDGISVYDGDYYQTPLGRVKIDSDLVKRLIQSSNKIYYNPEAEEKEHSVEVQVPFLQKVLQDFEMVSIVMGAQTFENAEILSNALAKNLHENTLIVASSDLSHYHNYEDAVKIDSICLAFEKNLDETGLYSAIVKKQCEMCGFGPVLAAIMTAKKLGKNEIKILRYANSGDVTGDKRRVVGYGAAVIYGTGRYTEEEEKELLSIARASITDFVRDGKVPNFEEGYTKLKENGAVFVTITEGGQLRGCIGTTAPVQPLYLATRDAAISAAVRDPRFPPLTDDELGKMHIEISVLLNFKRVFDIREITVGRHGLIIKKGNNSGLLLPQVATDYRWDRTIFLEQTCKKAGLDKSCWKEGAEIYTFEAEVFGE